MRKLRFTYKMILKLGEDIINHSFSLRCIPKSDSYQKVYSLKCSVSPYESLNKTTDGFGNIVYVGHCNAPHNTFQYETTGIVWVDRNSIVKEELNPIYKYPSKYTEFKESMADLYSKSLLFEGTDLQRAIFLMNLLYEKFTYTQGVTNINTTAGEAMKLGEGVCQDYSHILIALCRKCKIPARYVVGMIIGEGATHAWVEVYYDGSWYGLDPTHNKEVDDYFIKISHGRDYEDCIVDKGVFTGSTTQSQEIHVNVEEI